MLLALLVLTAPLDKGHVEVVGQLTCNRYSDLLVKEIDSPDNVGALRLSFVKGTAACSPDVVPGERVLDWWGTYVGRSRELLVFDAGASDDFVFMDLNGAIVFKDAHEGDFDDRGATIRYKRHLALACDASANKACAAKAKKAARTSQDIMALCKKAYPPEYAGSASVVAYDVIYDRKTNVATAKAGGKVTCAPTQ